MGAPYLRQRHPNLERRSDSVKSVWEENYFSSCSQTERKQEEDWHH